jgi:hypothetical protein
MYLTIYYDFKNNAENEFLFGRFLGLVLIFICIFIIICGLFLGVGVRCVILLWFFVIRWQVFVGRGILRVWGYEVYEVYKEYEVYEVSGRF